ncbi:Flp pilus assembly protein TadG [Caulobacter ginsengisoli]|uniref:Flp pilus assembly protein TadG n=1 Tax=Caulobacter ginsengisoli TaxID=400775 RepID=A0ABU0IWX9_9CAUL|nr:pilus assembly protein [Caulobacter ginsengisoli]MDQ0466490.1 Flp pilus assembly protein TadG [Caulobacter ginsengisoli]
MLQPIAQLGMRIVRSFRRDRRGAVAIQFAILAVPLAVLSFGLVDINRASVAKRELQDALDAATLMAARSSATNNTGLQTVGSAALVAQLGTMSDATLTSSSFVLGGTGNTTVISTAKVKVTPIIANLWLQGDMTVGAASQVVRSQNKLEVVLALDNTGSMAFTLGSSTKISALKTAATGLVSTLQAAASRSSLTDPIKIGVVPFSMSVNVGSTYQNEVWITGTQPNEYGEDIFNTPTNRFAMLTQMGATWAGCVESRPAPYDIQDTAPTPSIGGTMFVPYFAPDEPDDNKISYTRWGHTYYYDFDNNYISNDNTSSTVWKTRQGNTTKYSTSISSTARGTGDFGPNRECGLTPLLRLTSNFSTVTNKLNSMVSVGNTNVAMGLMWGWHVLSPNAPFADGVAYGTPKVTKVIILLTDGDNTNDEVSNPENSIYTGVGYIWQKRLLASGSTSTYLDETSSDTQRRDAIDDREAKLCANIKAKGIIIYSIGVGVSTHSKSILQTCASYSDYYYDVTDASQLDTVFDNIAGAIASLRISK